MCFFCVFPQVELEFAPSNRSYYAVADELVTLQVLVKNVKKLLVKVFEINTTTYYRENKTELSSDINLDGLGE